MIEQAQALMESPEPGTQDGKVTATTRGQTPGSAAAAQQHVLLAGYRKQDDKK